jgi:SAM-dependent methyltransferase
MTEPAPIDARAFHDFERAGWQRAAKYYQDTFGTLTMQAVGPLLDAAAVGPGTRLLDVATGPGYVAGAAAARGASTVGIDFSPEMVAQARLRHPGLEFLEGDAEALAFPTEHFDALVMNFGLLHLANPEAAMSEAHRVLAPGGCYAFTVWAGPEDAVGFGVVLRALERHGTSDVGLPAGPPFFRFSDAGEARRALNRAGLVGPEVRKLPLVWRLPSAEALFEAALHGGVRTSAALQAQTPAALAAIRHAVLAELARYAEDDGVAIPMSVVLASATKSAAKADG